MNTLTDDDPMPFGKFGPKPKGSGLLLRDVPADYLLWLYDNDDGLWKYVTNFSQPLKDYIEANWVALLKDHKDYIPQHTPGNPSPSMQLPRNHPPR